MKLHKRTDVRHGSDWTVWRAEQAATRQLYLVKEANPQSPYLPQLVARLCDEVQFFRRLDHPRFPKVIDAKAGGTRAVFADAQCSLTRYIAAHGPLPPTLVANVLAMAADGLEHLHGKKLGHGAVNLHTLFVGPIGDVLFADFLGYEFHSSAPLPVPDPEPRYQAPELIDTTLGKPGPASDLYCLGFAALELLAGEKFEKLFAVAEGANWLAWHADPYKQLADWQPALSHAPAGLLEVIAGLIVKRPDERQYTTAAQLKAALVRGRLTSDARIPPYRPGSRHGHGGGTATMPRPPVRTRTGKLPTRPPRKPTLHLHPTDGVGANQRTGGFPAYIIERPEHGNDVSMGVPSENTWGIGTGPFGAAPTVNVDAPGNNLGPGPTGVTPGDVPKGELPGMPSIQFFVPNRAPDSVGDLAMLSAFTHMFVHASDDPPLPGWNPEIVFADPTTLLGVPEENHWVTVGEQLGADMHFTYDTLAPVLTTGMNASNANPYLGVLDPTRFVPGGDLQAPVSLPDALAVPLATRIYDCFRAVGAASPRESLVQGVVNVNTAPIRNLRMLPFMSPEEDIAWPSTFGSYTIDGSLDVPNMPEADRAALVEAYRSVSRFTSNLTQRAADLNITGLRDFGYAGVPTNGFVNIGELSILSDWDDSVSSPSPEPPSFVGTTYGHFGELGQRLDPMTNDRFNTGVSELPPVVATVVGGTPPAHIVAGAGIVDGVLDRYPNAIMATPDGPVNLDPIDDAEERAAVFRAMANSVSTRSDVYTAWFIVRGYNPSHISAIRFPPDASTLDDEVIAFMLNQLKPAHESRWLAVFDRSNVRLPTDRPKVLLLAPLPTR